MKHSFVPGYYVKLKWDSWRITPPFWSASRALRHRAIHEQANRNVTDPLKIRQWRGKKGLRLW